MKNQILENIRTLKRQILPNEKLILFGSQARGDAHEDSDWDLLVLLNKNESNFNEDYSKYAYPFDKLGWEYGVAINAIIRNNEQRKQSKNFPFYMNVMREGIEIK